MNRSAAVIALTLVAMTAAACSRSSAPTAASSPPPNTVAPVSVAVAVLGGPTTGRGVSPTVLVRVGRSRTVPVLLDTGSIGLQLFAPAVSTTTRSGVTKTTVPDQITYAGGHRFMGVVANAVITIGSQSTAGVVPFGLVQSATCRASQPACPTARGMAEMIAAGTYGILGIGSSRGPNGLYNPLLAMRGTLGQRWSIHLHGTSGQLVLGARAPATAERKESFVLRTAGTLDNHRLWRDNRLPICVSVGTTRGCAFGLLDTGTPGMQVVGPAFPSLPPGAVTLGTPIEVERGTDPPFWTFPVGGPGSTTRVIVKPAARSLVNLGAPPYFAFTVTYDIGLGTITLS